VPKTIAQGLRNAKSAQSKRSRGQFEELAHQWLEMAKQADRQNW
jgi:hypothetical protein